jgi:hypothetical protein
MSARLCCKNPPIRNLGDEIESFLLLYLWVSGRYAPSTMDGIQRYNFLQHFEGRTGEGKEALFTAEDKVFRLQLSSAPLRRALNSLMKRYRSRYMMLDPDNTSPTAATAAIEEQAPLANYDWIKGELERALKEGVWPEGDHAVDQTVDVPDKMGGKKRRSNHTEYDTTNINRKRHRPNDLPIGEAGAKNDEDGEDEGKGLEE